MIVIKSKRIPEQVRTDVVARIVSVRQATKGSRQPLAALDTILATASEHGEREWEGGDGSELRRSRSQEAEA
jgi:hypothetical protein